MRSSRGLLITIVFAICVCVITFKEFKVLSNKINTDLLNSISTTGSSRYTVNNSKNSMIQIDDNLNFKIDTSSVTNQLDDVFDGFYIDKIIDKMEGKLGNLDF